MKTAYHLILAVVGLAILGIASIVQAQFICETNNGPPHGIASLKAVNETLT